MRKQAHIPVKTLRKVKLFRIPVVGQNGEQQESLSYTEFGGCLLVPVGDAHYFNTTTSAIRRHIRRGDLVPYLKNGQIKTDNSSRPVYFDLHEYMNLNLNRI